MRSEEGRRGEGVGEEKGSGGRRGELVETRREKGVGRGRGEGERWEQKEGVNWVSQH